MAKKQAIKNIQPNTQITIYETEDGKARVEVRFEDENVWLTQAQMSELFDRDQSVISKHIKNVFSEGELDEKSNMQNLHTAISDKPVVLYSLDVIISVGYRVKSLRGTQFRIWATERISEYIVKGFVIDSERLKNPDLPFDYFEELLQRIADIRTSEKRFYRKITDIYATSVDYDPADEKSILFFKTVQNKVHYAITGSTAAEIVASRVSSKKPNAGMTNWRGDTPTKEEAVIAKNYLNEQELLVLNNLVEQYLVFAAGQAMQRVPMYMKD